MAHYAFLDDNNVVTEVIVGKNEGEDGKNWELQYGAFRNQVCKRTSYNTRGGVHYDQATGEPSADQTKAYRKNYAGIGYTYDQTKDAFIPPKPFESWVLNETSCLWDPPTPMPDDGKMYTWDEETTSWVEVDGA
jgi:hypothetical protein